MNKYNKIVFVNGSAPALNADNLNHMDEGIERATDGAIALESEIATARGGQNSLGARLDGIDSSVSNKADKSTVSQLSARMQTAEKALTGKANATDVANALKSKEDNSNKVSSKTDITDSSANYPSIEYLNEYYYDANETYSSAETDEFLGNKADEVDVDDVKAFVGYTDEDIVGLCVDFENKTFKRLAGAVGLSAGSDFDKFTMYGGRRRCNVSDDGTITAYYGDENYAEDGSNGQVMVFQPKFYYKVVPLKLEKNTDSGIGYHIRRANYYVSSKPKAGFKLHPAFFDENGNAVDYILFSADEGSMFDVSANEYVNDGTNTDTAIEVGDLLCSVANVKPISGLKKPLNKVNLETMAQNRGSGWHLETIKATSANQLLMMIELAMMNSQTGIGQGVVSISDNSSYNCSSLTGSTADLGNGTGQAVETINEKGGIQTTETANGKVAVTYRGVENPWGNISKHIQGINIWGDGSMCGGQPYVANNFTFNESKHSDNYEPVGFTLANANGYIKAMGYGSEKYDWLFMPSEIGGTSALPVGDIVYIAPNLNGYRIVQQGGSCRSGDRAGSFSLICNGTVGDRSRSAGGRLIYVPTAKSGNTPTKSYSASEVDALLANKYDSSNIESGTSTLTPYSTITDKIKSASCTYKTIGDVVIVSATVKMNAVTIGANSSYPLIDLPYKCIAVDDVFCVGISNLGKLNTIAMAALFILTIVMCFFIFGNGNGMGAAGDDSMSFGAAVELSVAMPLSWLPLISDYTREAEKPFKATLASTLVYGAVSCWMYIIGMSASILTGESDIAKIMLKSGLSIAGLVIVILSTVTTTFLDAYSAGISSESIFSKLKGKYVAVAVTIVGVIAAIVYPMDDITDFLYLIGSVFAPMIAIQIADFFILKKDRANKAVDICNIIVWLAGFAAYRFLMNVDIIVGNTLPDMVFTIILCVIVTKIADKITSKSKKA